MEESNARKGEWQDALKEISSFDGHQLDEDGNEVECRKNVVKEICRFRRGIKPPKLLDFEPVGIEDQVREVKALLVMEGTESALAVNVYGFGGIGKSTIAASVVESLDWSSTDLKFCWVSIEEKIHDRTSHILKLQKDIIKNLQGVEPELQNLKEGRDGIKEALNKKRSLLFIDNVADKDYVKDLLPTDLPSNELETNLRIMITSREKNVKAELKIKCKEYEVKCLCDEASKFLLSQAILEKSAVMDKDEEDMMNKLAAACSGVPLLLSVFGKHLRAERDESSYQERYKEALNVLRKGNLDSYRGEDLGRRLMSVYDKIKDVDVEEAFLDICTYFHGWQWNLLVDIVGSDTLEDLRRKSLISKSSSGEVIVHPILRSIAMKKANLTRFSNYKELSYALEDDIKDVKGISLPDDDNSSITIESKKLEAMHHSLRVLMLGDRVTLEGPPCQKAFRNLRFLRVGDITVFPFKDPSKIFLNRSEPGVSLSSLPSSLNHVCHEVSVVECEKFVKLLFQNLCSSQRFIVQRRLRLSSLELPEEPRLPASPLDLN